MLAAATLLHVWERGQQCTPAERSMGLLSLALPGSDRDRLSALDLGVRDWHLLQLRIAWFGPRLSGYTDCLHCGERVEFEFDARAIGSEPPPPDCPVYTARTGERFRLPTIADLIAVDCASDREAAADRLFERCRVDRLAVGDAGDTSFDEVDAGLAALAIERGIQLTVSCALCGERSQQLLDPGEFLWADISTHAVTLLEEIHQLARAYGWPERDILDMSAARRSAYLDRIDR